ncbi:type II toxin-antitoxin system Phd/YefM family antitoxin [Bradyrhizobium sp.]
MAANEAAAAANLAEKKTRHRCPARKIVMGTAIPPRLGGLMTVNRTCTVCRTREEEDRLPHVSYSKLRDNLASYMDEVCNGRAPLVVTRRNARSVVLMSEEDYDGLIETVHLLNSPANASRLLRAIADADRDMLTNARSPWPSRAERAR